MQTAYDFEIRVLSCENCGAPIQTSAEGGQTSCNYCGTPMLVQRRQVGRVQLAHDSGDEQARVAKLRMQVSAPLEQNPYSTVRPPPGCEDLTRAAIPEILAKLEQRWREAAALVRREPSFEHQRLLWWCASQLNQGYGLNGKDLERRAVLESTIELLADPGFRHMLFVNLAGAAAGAGDFAAAHRWIEQCDPKPEDIMLDSGYRIGMASVLVREGQFGAVLELVGASVGTVPESHQYRMLFATYRIHALECLGREGEAMQAAEAIGRDPEIGGLLAEVLRKNKLAPRTAATLEAGQGALQGALGRLEGNASAAPAPTPNQGRVTLIIALVVVFLTLGTAAAVVLPMLIRFGIL